MRTICCDLVTVREADPTDFYHVLGYKRARVRSEHKHNDVRVNDRRDQPWLVVEVKPLLETERDRRAARRQGFDYAHRLGMRFVAISDGDYYEIFDRCCGERLRYDEMRQAISIFRRFVPVIRICSVCLLRSDEGGTFTKPVPAHPMATM